MNTFIYYKSIFFISHVLLYRQFKSTLIMNHTLVKYSIDMKTSINMQAITIKYFIFSYFKTIFLMRYIFLSREENRSFIKFNLIIYHVHDRF